MIYKILKISLKGFAIQVMSAVMLLLALSVPTAEMRAADPLMLKAKLDSTQLLMGKMTMLHLELVTDKGRKGEFPIFTQAAMGDGIASTCGDSVELRLPMTVDTIDLGSNRLQITYHVPLQAFDSGLYRIPPIDYVSGRDTAKSNSLVLKVLPLSGLTADSELAPMEGIAPAEPGSWTDYIPDWLYYNWWWMLLSLLALVAAVILIVKLKKRGGLKNFVIKPAKPISPWDEALNSLNELQQRKLFEQGLEKEYYTNLTEILRIYLEKRFGIRALEMTTREILDTFASQGEEGERRDYVRKILDMADFVKFAKMRPLLSEAEESMDYARKFVQETIPVQKPVEPSEEKPEDDAHELPR